MSGLPQSLQIYDLVQKLVESAASPRDRLILELLQKTGCRVSELTGVPKTAFRPSDRALTLVTLKKRVKRSCRHCGKRVAKSHQHCPSCGRGLEYIEAPLLKRNTRTFILPPDLSQRLAAYARRVHGPRLFPLTRQRVYQVVRLAAERAGFSGKVMQGLQQTRAHHVHPHNFREAFITLGLEKRDDSLGRKAIQAMAGHESFETTMRYANVTPQGVQEVYDDIMGVPQRDRRRVVAQPAQAEGEGNTSVLGQHPARRPVGSRKHPAQKGRIEGSPTSARPVTLTDMVAFLKSKRGR